MTPTGWLPWLMMALLVPCAVATAETRYVTDQLLISLRANPDPDAALLTTLRTDTPLEVLSEAGEFLRVRTPEGQEGYVLGRYVSREVPKPRQLERLRQERDDLRQRVQELEATDRDERLREARAEIAALQEQSAGREAELEEARRRLAAAEERYRLLEQDAADVVALLNDRERLQARNEQLLTDLDRLQQENEDLLQSTMIRWFLAGGGVFFGGWIAGKLSRRKRRSF